MLEYFQLFIQTILGDGVFNYIDNYLVIDIMSICLISLTFYLVVRLVLNMFKFFGGVFK